MKIIEITALSNGAHRNQEGNFDVVPAGWAVIPDDIVIPDTYPFVEVTAQDGIVTELTPGTLPEPEPVPLDEIKAARIAQSKMDLAAWLEGNPLLWADGKRYSVTQEKQSLLMGNIAAYQIEAQLNPEAIVTWNASGEACVPWDINALCTLAVDIKNYVKPRVSYQQAKEVAVTACETAEAVDSIVIDYDTME